VFVGDGKISTRGLRFFIQNKAPWVEISQAQTKTRDWLFFSHT